MEMLCLEDFLSSGDGFSKQSNSIPSYLIGSVTVVLHLLCLLRTSVASGNILVGAYTTCIVDIYIYIYK
jgi:hypothetical protein